MRTLLILLGKDFANLRRNRAALVLSFIVPMIIIYIVGLVFGLGRTDSGPTGIPFAVVNQSDNPAAQKLVDALQAEKSFRIVTQFVNPDKTTRPLTEADLRPMIKDRQFSYALVIPSDVLSDSRLGLHLKILSDPRNDIEDQIVNGLLQKTIFSNVPQLLGQSLQARARKFLGSAGLDTFNRSIVRDVVSTFGGDPDRILARMQSGSFGLDQLTQRLAPAPAPGGTAGGAASPDIFSRMVQIDHEQVVGKDVKSPAATRIVGGYAVMFLLFALSNSAAAFFDEKNTGVFQRLLSSSVSRAQLLWSRFLYGVVFGLCQLMALFLAGHLLYGVDVFGHLGNLLIVCASVAAACTGFGMLLAAVTRSPEAARSLATLLVITMSACGGAWFPVSLMPEFMQHIARYTLVYWSIEGFGAVLWAGNSLGEILPILGILLGTTAVVMSIAVWRFNRSPIFE
jgi:ABC-2 type transport system permease protein